MQIFSGDFEIFDEHFSSRGWRKNVCIYHFAVRCPWRQFSTINTRSMITESITFNWIHIAFKSSVLNFLRSDEISCVCVSPNAGCIYRMPCELNAVLFCFFFFISLFFPFVGNAFRSRCSAPTVPVAHIFCLFKSFNFTSNWMNNNNNI